MLLEWEPEWCLIRKSKLSVTGVEDKELRYNNGMKKKTITKKERQKIAMELNRAAEIKAAKRQQSILDHGGHN